jgi:hypothetical protein
MRNQLKSPHNGGGNGRGKPEHEGLDLLAFGDQEFRDHCIEKCDTRKICQAWDRRRPASGGERNIAGRRAHKFAQQPERKSEEDPVDVLKMRFAKAKREITKEEYEANLKIRYYKGKSQL